MAAGEYIAPEKIENVYIRSPFLAQAFVYGDSLRPQLVAIVIPDPEVCPARVWGAAGCRLPAGSSRQTLVPSLCGRQAKAGAFPARAA